MPKIFGKLLTGRISIATSRPAGGRASASAAAMQPAHDGKPIRVASRVAGDAHVFDIRLDTRKNEPVAAAEGLSGTGARTRVEPRDHGDPAADM